MRWVTVHVWMYSVCECILYWQTVLICYCCDKCLIQCYCCFSHHYVCPPAVLGAGHYRTLLMYIPATDAYLSSQPCYCYLSTDYKLLMYTPATDAHLSSQPCYCCLSTDYNIDSRVTTLPCTTTLPSLLTAPLWTLLLLFDRVSGCSMSWSWRNPAHH